MTDRENLTEKARVAGTPYDDVFRTLLNDCSPLIIPVVNEVFGEQYSGKEKITFSPNEHFLNRQGGEEAERITDTSFEIKGKKYHLECQSSTDHSMLVRFFEYDTQIALDEGEIRGDVLTVALPHSAVLFLRHHAATPDALKVRMETPGGTVEYAIRVVKAQQYSLEEIFDKNLLFLLPFYIFSHEARFGEYEKDGEKRKALQGDYEQMKSRLEDLLHKGIISEYTRCTITDMSNKVLEHIAARYDAVREGVKEIMGGEILEYEAKTIYRKGIEEGREEGIKKGREEGIEKGIEEGIKALVEICREVGIPYEAAAEKVAGKLGLTREEAEERVKKYWN